VISGLTPSDGGQIRLGADRLDGLSAHAIARRGVGRTFQIPRPLGRMTVLENVLVYGHDQPGEGLTRVFTTPKRVSAEEHRARERAYALLESVELAHLAAARADTLSGGQKKLLELARVLMSDPRIILLDEPGAGVNPTLMRSLVETIRALRAGAHRRRTLSGPCRASPRPGRNAIGRRATDARDGHGPDGGASSAAPR
jgi:branched-chain amino acid transport system ATP-binding protein